MNAPTFRSEQEIQTYMEISVMNGEGLFNHNPSLQTLGKYYKSLIERKITMTRLICEFKKRILIINEKQYEIEPEVAKYLIHNIPELKVVYKMG
jgi:hypothetical protein